MYFIIPLKGEEQNERKNSTLEIRIDRYFSGTMEVFFRIIPPNLKEKREIK